MSTPSRKPVRIVSKEDAEATENVRRITGIAFGLFIILQTPLFWMEVSKEPVIEKPISPLEIAAGALIKAHPSGPVWSQMLLLPGVWYKELAILLTKCYQDRATCDPAPLTDFDSLLAKADVSDSVDAIKSALGPAYMNMAIGCCLMTLTGITSLVYKPSKLAIFGVIFALYATLFSGTTRVMPTFIFMSFMGAYMFFVTVPKRLVVRKPAGGTAAAAALPDSGSAAAASATPAAPAYSANDFLADTDKVVESPTAARRRKTPRA